MPLSGIVRVEEIKWNRIDGTAKTVYSQANTDTRTEKQETSRETQTLMYTHTHTQTHEYFESKDVQEIGFKLTFLGIDFEAA